MTPRESEIICAASYTTRIRNGSVRESYGYNSYVTRGASRNGAAFTFPPLGTSISLSRIRGYCVDTQSSFAQSTRMKGAYCAGRKPADASSFHLSLVSSARTRVVSQNSLFTAAVSSHSSTAVAHRALRAILALLFFRSFQLVTCGVISPITRKLDDKIRIHVKKKNTWIYSPLPSGCADTLRGASRDIATLAIRVNRTAPTNGNLTIKRSLRFDKPRRYFHYTAINVVSRMKSLNKTQAEFPKKKTRSSSSKRWPQKMRREEKKKKKWRR